VLRRLGDDVGVSGLDTPTLPKNFVSQGNWAQPEDVALTCTNARLRR
jgi:hypothetical protein